LVGGDAVEVAHVIYHQEIGTPNASPNPLSRSLKLSLLFGLTAMSSLRSEGAGSMGLSLVIPKSFA
jgi:hypothetical protein